MKRKITASRRNTSRKRNKVTKKRGGSMEEDPKDRQREKEEILDYMMQHPDIQGLASRYHKIPTREKLTEALDSEGGNPYEAITTLLLKYQIEDSARDIVKTNKKLGFNVNYGDVIDILRKARFNVGETIQFYRDVKTVMKAAETDYKTAKSYLLQEDYFSSTTSTTMTVLIAITNIRKNMKEKQPLLE